MSLHLPNLFYIKFIIVSFEKKNYYIIKYICILFLTQCFPSRIGGIESLVSNLALSIGKNNKVAVFADQQHIFYDAIYDMKYQNTILVKRYRGIKYFRRRKKN